MREPLDLLLEASGHAATRDRLTRLVGWTALDDEIRRGHLVRLFPRVYARPWQADQPTVRDRAALLCVGHPAVLSHRTALARHGIVAAGDAVHVTVPHTRCPRGQRGLVVHRAQRVPRQHRVDGLLTASVASAAVQSWPTLAPDDRRGVVITAVRQRRCTTAALTLELVAAQRLPGRAELTQLVALLAAGCRSELEIWGLLRVFDAPGLRHGTRQRPIAAGNVTYWLDLAFDAERVAVELDGDAYHSTPRQRDHDRRRDARLATMGWLTLRFSYRRLHDDPAGCRRDTLATLADRMRTLR